MERGAWQATVLGITELNMTEYTHPDTHTHIHRYRHTHTHTHTYNIYLFFHSSISPQVVFMPRLFGKMHSKYGGMQTSLPESDLIPFKYYPEVKLLDYMVVLVLIFEKYLYCFLQQRYKLAFLPVFLRVPIFFRILINTCLLFHQIIAILIGTKWYLISALIAFS